MNKKIITALTIVLYATILLAQSVTGVTQSQQTDVKNSEKYFEVAKEAYNNKAFKKAIIYLEYLLEEEDTYSKDPRLTHWLAQCYQSKRMYSAADSLYKWLDNHYPQQYPLALLQRGKMLQSLGKYQKALEIYDSFIESYITQSPDTAQMAKRHIQSCQFAIEHTRRSNLKYTVHPLKSLIKPNSSQTTPYVKDNTLFFTGTITKNKPKQDPLPQQNQEEITIPAYRLFQAKKKGTSHSWEQTKSLNIQPPHSSWEHISAPTFTPNSSFLFYTVSSPKDTSSHIYKSSKRGRSYTSPQKIDFSGFDFASTKTPMAISFKNKSILYFAADIASPPRQTDLYYGFITTEGKVQNIQPLGKKINTENDEMAPFYDPHEEALYFASNGHLGMGNYDIFKIHGNPIQGWDTLQNLGPPVNSGADDYFYYQNNYKDSATGYFASNRHISSTNSTTHDHIHRFNKAAKHIILQGQVVDKNQNGIEDASLKIINHKTNEVIDQDRTDLNGNYKVAVPREYNVLYDVEIIAKEYMFFNKKLRLFNGRFVPLETLMVVSSEDKTSEGNIINFPLKNIKPGNKITISNIEFKNKTATLKPKSFPKLKRLSQYLKQHTNIKVEIRSHTDNIGTFKRNLELSKNRAQKIVTYLQKQGVKENQLQYEGSSFEDPIATNSSPKGRRKNRRIELKIIQ